MPTMNNFMFDIMEEWCVGMLSYCDEYHTNHVKKCVTQHVMEELCPVQTHDSGEQALVACGEFFVNSCMTLTNYAAEKLCRQNKDKENFVGQIRVVCNELCQYQRTIQFHENIDTCNLLRCGKFFQRLC